ncbi:MAG: TetR/AcrR family transcriptional regulator [Bacteroidota bacterium]
MKGINGREKFIAVSIDLFLEKGFNGTAMQDIANQLGLQAPTLYNYVKSKQGLLQELLFEMVEKFEKGMADIVESSYTPLEKLKAIIAMNVRLTAQHPHQVGLLVNEWKHLESPHLEVFQESRTHYESMFAAVIRQGMETGELRQMDLDFMTHSVLSSIRWLFQWYRPREEEINPIELERQMIEFVLQGVAV